MAIPAAAAAATDSSTLDRTLVNGMAWTAVLRWSAQVVSWVGTGIAARLLVPGDYGLVGMAMLAIGLVRMVEDFGMDAVLVQDRSIEGDRQAHLAGLVLLAGASFAAIFALLSPLIAGFFKEPQVASLVSALGLLCVADALQVIPRAVLQRQMEFRKLAWLQFIQVVVTQAVLVLAAYAGWGVWSLVVNTLAGTAVVTLLLIMWRPYAVRTPRQLRELAAPLLQGWRILASRFAYYAYSSADQTVIGRMLGKDALGVYSFAMTFSTTVSQEISSVLSRVVPGIFSTVQDRRPDLRRYFLKLTELLSYLALPVSFGIGVTADLLVAIVLGPKWEAVVVPLRFLCAYAAFYSCQVLVGHLLLWTGRFRANMWCSILAAVVMPLAFYFGSEWGLLGIVWVWVIGYPLLNVPAFIIGFRAIDISWLEWLGSFAPALIGCVAMVGVVMAVRAALPPLAVPLQAAICAAVGAVSYVATVVLLFRSRVVAMWDFLRVVRSGPLPAH